MRAVRHWMIAAAIAFAAPVFAQEKKADPHAQPTKPTAKTAEPAKPAEHGKTAEPAKPTATAAATTGATIGKPAPDFTLKDVSGKDVKLADSKGKITVLVWGNAECPAFGRVAKGKLFDKAYNQIKDKVVWYTVDSTATAKADDAKKFATENAVPGMWLMDPTGATGKAYGAKTTPHAFVIDAKGNLAYMGAFDDDAKGGNDKARNYVVEAVEALSKGSTVATATTDPYGCSVKYKN